MGVLRRRKKMCGLEWLGRIVPLLATVGRERPGAALLVVAVPLTVAVLQGQQANMPLLHRSGEAHRSFEVATIKPNNETHPGFNLSMNPAHFAARHISVNDLISWAYYAKSDFGNNCAA